MVGLLELGVIDLLDFGVVGLLAIDPEQKSGNRCGETVLFSDSQATRTIRKLDS